LWWGIFFVRVKICKNIKKFSVKVMQNTSAIIYIVEPSFEGSGKNYIGVNHEN